MAARLDRTGKRARWDAARAGEAHYASRLRSVALQVGSIIRALAPEGRVRDLPRLLQTLAGYADAMQPWAEAVAEYMVADVARRNERIWRQNSRAMGIALRAEMRYSNAGIIFREAMDEQLDLIRSIPIEAGRRVQKLTEEARITGVRAEAISKEIMRTTQVTQSRARLIARTEVSRTAANLMQARAMSAGSKGYIWRTSKDADVRESHQKMEGVYVPWDDPPKTDKSLDPYHAGCGPNCRCFAEPVLPDL